jgi:hypothetical protein
MLDRYYNIYDLKMIFDFRSNGTMFVRPACADATADRLAICEQSETNYQSRTIPITIGGVMEEWSDGVMEKWNM